MPLACSLNADLNEIQNSVHQTLDDQTYRQKEGHASTCNRSRKTGCSGGVDDTLCSNDAINRVPEETFSLSAAIV
jgi:hypothetical protein